MARNKKNCVKANKKIIPVILVGGQGTRLWPLSVSNCPKQFLPLLGRHSLFQQTLLRINNKNLYEKPIIIGNYNYAFLINKQLNELEIEPSAIILEPEGRNSAAAIAIATLFIDRNFPDAISLILPSDHYISDNTQFENLVISALPFSTEKIITFGIQPSFPATEYGYIQIGENLDDKLYKIKKFTEKPNAEIAIDLILQGDHIWNSGLFMASSHVFLEEFKIYQSKMLEFCQEALTRASKSNHFIYLDQQSFLPIQSISFDYAIMEHTQKGVIKKTDIGWSDLGNWFSLWENSEKDEEGNVKLGDVVTLDVKNSYIRSDHGLVTVIGLEDVIVVSTAQAQYIAHKKLAHKISQIIPQLPQGNQKEAITGHQIDKPWGHFTSLNLSADFQVKQIVVNPGEKISLQKHSHRAEHWIIVSGWGTVTLDDEVFVLSSNEYIYIPKGSLHRIENDGEEPLIFIEVQYGDYLGEDDIIRYQDSYGRVVNA